MRPILAEHAGQIAFPGGKIDATDASPVDAALREAWEEVGLTRDFVEPIGYLDLYGTSFGFRILPTVARVRPGFDLCINTDEVDDAFEVPLSFLMNPVNHKLGRKQFRGRHALVLRDAVRRTKYLGRNGRDPARTVRASLSEMIRPVLMELGIFLIPFAIYAAYLIANRVDFMIAASWPPHIVVRLSLAALALVVVSFILLANFSGSPPDSTYVPAHLENGKLVPGVER